MNFLLVGIGGMIGAMLRYGVSLLVMGSSLALQRLPLATLIVNIAGSLALGLLAGYLRSHGTSGSGAFLLLGTGLCGGFTTFSAFSLEVTDMLRSGVTGAAASYILLSLIGSVGALFLGMYLTSRA